MQELWFAGTKGKEERDKVKQDFALAHNAFQRLLKILQKKRKKYPTDYDMSNWAYAQAHVNGYNDALDDITKLIEEAETNG